MALRLSVIINLSGVSQILRCWALREDNWCVLTDKENVLYAFIHNVISKSKSTSYPITKVQCMYGTGYSDIHNSVDYLGPLPIIFHNPAASINFYECFVNYQCLHVDNQSIFTATQIISSNSIYVSPSLASISAFIGKSPVGNVKEIYAPNHTIDFSDLIKCCGQIEKLQAFRINNFFTSLKTSNLVYLFIADEPYSDIMQYLPDTLESLIFLGQLKTQSFGYLGRLPCLNYLKIKMHQRELLTTLNIHTLHIHIVCYATHLRIELDCIQNIIITHEQSKLPNGHLSISSLHALTCQIVDTKISHLVLNFPAFTKVTRLNGIEIKKYSKYLKNAKWII